MRKKIGIICLLMVICIISIAPKSYGAIASKPTTKTDGSNVLVNKSISEAFVLCKNMTSNGESLYGATVKPHLATNKDWGAVAYLSNSSYGTNTAGKNTGIQLTMNGVKYYSTTGNTSGVMNWGKNPYINIVTQTSGIVTGLTSSNSEIFKYKDTEYVEYIDPTNDSLTKGMAMQETGKFSVKQTNYYYFCSVRTGLYSGAWGCNLGNGYWGGLDAGREATFRPAIWN